MQKSRTDKKLFGKIILVAEDVEMNQQLIRHILEASGAQVVIAKNGSEALDRLKQKRFDCVLMDVQMPEMDGIQATEKIRQLSDPVLSSIPIIALTANCLPDDLIRYEQAGMDDYLPKPIVEAHLLDAILSTTAIRKQIVSATQEPTENRLYDLSMIQSVSGGDTAFINKMIVLFVETVPLNVQELVDATLLKNWDKVAKMAHKLKSTIDSMGIRTLHDAIRKIEMNAKNNEDLEQMPNRVRQVESVVTACVLQLKSIINN